MGRDRKAVAAAMAGVLRYVEAQRTDRAAGPQGASAWVRSGRLAQMEARDVGRDRAHGLGWKRRGVHRG